jgi:zinc and cadmium transporter
MNAGVWVLSSAALLGISAISLLGAAGLVLRSSGLRSVLLLLVPFAAGALLGNAFLHLIPEIANSTTGLDRVASGGLLAGLLSFFVLEKILHWHHAHLPHEEVLHPVAVSNLVGDGLHNFLDGAIVASAFVASPQLGVATAVAVALHEIPQELGDFGILVHAGLTPRRALLFNFASGLTALAGMAATLTFVPPEGTERILLPFSAGAFIYISSTDLIPELHKEPEPGKSLLQVLSLLAGVGVMAVLLPLE